MGLVYFSNHIKNTRDQSHVLWGHSSALIGPTEQLFCAEKSCEHIEFLYKLPY